ncbi:tetratricopeptide repeat protein 19, mitochondrial isoform X2 [Corythoichthys intestinalis]|uniref:tetratricopeptide repeat protein 19, mitochondrial isoform X2 n=1 Tax=Corythoichthys intestinalis TaxID=161448 RepID=UPI0025A67F66|nr:tetratricopeptide repeat protein 19, mitochondrial isoform X2 [Corythoichthys intestinalis]
MAAAYAGYLSKCCHVFRRSTLPKCNILPSIFARVTRGQRNAAVTSHSQLGTTIEGACSLTRKSGGSARLATLMAALSLFGSSESKEEELILLLKKAKLSIAKGELEAASSFLHAAAVIAQQERHRAAIIYTYSQMANLAYVQGQLLEAEKLFKAAMSYMLADGMPQDDNAFVEMSLKLAAMYAQQNKPELAEHGFRFCLETLEAKVQKLQETPAHQLTEEEEILRKDTRLLLGLCLDSRARYLASTRRLSGAADDYSKALEISAQEQGPHHHQTLVLMSDLSTILDMQGRHDDALALIRQAVDAGRASGHQDLHILLANMAAILLHAAATTACAFSTRPCHWHRPPKTRRQ